MMRRTLLCVVMGLGLANAVSGAAQEQGLWRASSSTARSITGDIGLSNERLTINFSSFVISQIRPLQPAELSSAFDSDSNSGGIGHLYRLHVPATARFLHKNTLCGSEETQWMATYVEGRNLKLAFFSSEKPPLFTLEALQNSTDLCGVYSYIK
ncbi:hypothetical protein [Granulicella sp. WH15]|uniref:hypothetical protein n=1 Tax=Granulicella sp. WH15 TaxID=2602070 RepID=UPI002102177E|nr:hypothetical protein [Granulicella sp. WH15]